MTRREEYEICRVRGHEPSGIQLGSNPPMNVCRHCGAGYRYARTLVETNVPPDNRGPRPDSLNPGPDSLKPGDPL
jgi:hypothetical protein